VAITLLVDGTAHWTLVTSPLILAGFVLPAIFLCLGFMTPYCAVFSCLMQVVHLTMTGCPDKFHLCMFIVTSAALALLGPGAYSIDARIFGRKIIRLPDPSKPKS